MRLRAPAIANAAADADADANAADSLSSSLFFQTPPLKTMRIFDEERGDQKRFCFFAAWPSRYRPRLSPSAAMDQSRVRD